MWIRLRLWLASVLARRRFDADLADELAFHLRTRQDYWEASGLPAAEARRRARLEFGSPGKVREQVQDARRGAWLGQLERDVRYGLRSLRRHPAFSAMAVLSLAIGIGANAAIVAIVQSVLLHEPPLHDPASLVNIYETEDGRGFGPMSYPNIEELREGTTHVFSGIAASTFVGAPIDRGGEVATVMGEAVSGGAFAMLGIAPQLGRAIAPEDDVARGGHPVVMLSHGYWQRAFGGEAQVVGRTLRMGGRGYTIIGVAPADYRGGLPAITPAFYVPIAMADDLMGLDMLDQRDYHTFFVKARLRPGVTRTQAEHAASLVATTLTRTRPEGWRAGAHFTMVPTADVNVYPGLDALLRAAALLLIVVVAMVLLLACTNLASFLLARALDRRQEVAVRRALGATRWALARQLLVESGLLGVAGAAAGLVFAVVLVDVLLSTDLPLPYGMRLDLHFGLERSALFEPGVLAFTVAAGFVAGLFLGLVPAVQGTRADLIADLKTGSGGSDASGTLRWRNMLVVAQVSISLVLIVGAGLFLRSWHHSLSVDPGFGREPTSVLTVMLPGPPSNATESTERTRLLLERLRTYPGVEAAGLIWPLPLDFASSSTDFTLDAHVPPAGRETFRADRAVVDGGFFDAAGMTIVSGRTFSDADRRDSQPVAIISQMMSRRYWPDGDALGRVLRRPDPGQPDLTVVGVVSDINVRSLGEPPRDVVYVAHAQGDGAAIFNVLVRTAADSVPRPEALVAAGREVAPDLQLMQSTTMAQHLAMSRLPAQMGAFLLSTFGVLAAALVMIGVSGMMRFIVARRTREIGIRLALGAGAAGVARRLAAQGVRLVVAGGAIGLALSLLVTRALASLLAGVDAFDPVALLAALSLLGGTAWLAAWLPARRASQVDPLTALRTE